MSTAITPVTAPQPRRSITELKFTDYEHPWDRNSMSSLRALPPMRTFIKRLNEIGADRILNLRTMGSCLRVTDRSVPSVHTAFREACNALDIEDPPRIFIECSAEINAYAAGIASPLIVLSSALVDAFTDDELIFVIGHELGHIKSEHAMFGRAAIEVLRVGDYFSGNMAAILTGAFKASLHAWSRYSEFSSDRAGLLACQHLDPAITALLKLSGLPRSQYGNPPVQEFLEQGKDLKFDELGILDKAAHIYSMLPETHPWSVARAVEIKNWYESGTYLDILDRQCPPRLDTHSEDASPVELLVSVSPAPPPSADGPEPPTDLDPHPCRCCGRQVRKRGWIEPVTIGPLICPYCRERGGPQRPTAIGSPRTVAFDPHPCQCCGRQVRKGGWIEPVTSGPLICPYCRERGGPPDHPRFRGPARPSADRRTLK